MIHPTAIVDPRTQVGEGVQIGPYAVIEGVCTLGRGVVVDAHCIVRGNTVIGEDCRIGPAAYVGMPPQHLGFTGGETYCIIGAGTIVREGASIHRATKPGIENATRIGAKCFLMGDTHVGHDCQIADSVTIAHGSMLGGHVEVGERAFLGGGSGIHQFCRIGRGAIVAGNEVVTKDVPPFGAARYNALKGYNAIGCRRMGLSEASRRAIRQAYRCLHTHRTVPAAVQAIQALQLDCEEIREMLQFIATSRRGIQPSIHSLQGMSSGLRGEASLVDEG